MLSTKDAIQLCTSIRASAREASTNRADCRWARPATVSAGRLAGALRGRRARPRGGRAEATPRLPPSRQAAKLRHGAEHRRARSSRLLPPMNLPRPAPPRRTLARFVGKLMLILQALEDLPCADLVPNWAEVIGEAGAGDACEAGGRGRMLLFADLLGSSPVPGLALSAPAPSWPGAR